MPYRIKISAEKYAETLKLIDCNKKTPIRFLCTVMTLFFTFNGNKSITQAMCQCVALLCALFLGKHAQNDVWCAQCINNMWQFSFCLWFNNEIYFVSVLVCEFGTGLHYCCHMRQKKATTNAFSWKDSTELEFTKKNK